MIRGSAKRQERLACSSSMGIGFTQDDSSHLVTPSKELVTTNAEFGLTAKQMQMLGLTNDSWMNLPEIDAVSYPACCLFYFCLLSRV